MWYFSWILGLGLACSFAIINAMWYEAHASNRSDAPDDDDQASDV